MELNNLTLIDLTTTDTTDTTDTTAFDYPAVLSNDTPDTVTTMIGDESLGLCEHPVTEAGAVGRAALVRHAAELRMDGEALDEGTLCALKLMYKVTGNDGALRREARELMISLGWKPSLKVDVDFRSPEIHQMLAGGVSYAKVHQHLVKTYKVTWSQRTTERKIQNTFPPSERSGWGPRNGVVQQVRNSLWHTQGKAAPGEVWHMDASGMKVYCSHRTLLIMPRVIHIMDASGNLVSHHIVSSESPTANDAKFAFLKAAHHHGLPGTLVVDAGPEFANEGLLSMLEFLRVDVRVLEPGDKQLNGIVERIHKTLLHPFAIEYPTSRLDGNSTYKAPVLGNMRKDWERNAPTMEQILNDYDDHIAEHVRSNNKPGIALGTPIDPDLYRRAVTMIEPDGIYRVSKTGVAITQFGRTHNYTNYNKDEPTRGPGRDARHTLMDRVGDNLIIRVNPGDPTQLFAYETATAKTPYLILYRSDTIPVSAAEENATERREEIARTETAKMARQKALEKAQQARNEAERGNETPTTDEQIRLETALTETAKMDPQAELEKAQEDRNDAERGNETPTTDEQIRLEIARRIGIDPAHVTYGATDTVRVDNQDVRVTILSIDIDPTAQHLSLGNELFDWWEGITRHRSLRIVQQKQIRIRVRGDLWIREYTDNT